MTSDAEIVERLRENVQALRHYDFPEVAKLEIEAAESITRLSARVEELERGLTQIMVGGNHLGLIIGADHPLYTASFDEARAHYLDRGRNEEYEAWCCWKNIMEARSLLSPSTNLKE